MNVLVVTPPEPLVSLEEAKAHLRMTDVADEDVMIGGLIAAASDHIDGPRGWLSRSVGVQTLEIRVARFDRVARLPYGPAIEIETIQYVDVNGDVRDLDPAAYFLDGDDLAPIPGQAWPRIGRAANPVRVRYRAGFEKVPPAIKHAALLLIGQWFAVREATNVGNIVNELPFSVRALLTPYRFIKV